MELNALCFVDMPFGKKTDLASGTEIDFDHIYAAAVRPAIEEAGLDVLRGDEERTGGIIHSAFQERVKHGEKFRQSLARARNQPSNDERPPGVAADSERTG